MIPTASNCGNGEMSVKYFEVCINEDKNVDVYLLNLFHPLYPSATLPKSSI